MKRPKLSWLVIVLGILISGCTDIMDDSQVQSNPLEETECNVRKVTKEDALSIANRVLNNASRSEISAYPTFEYVINDNSSRNFTLPDTLAYVLNYPNNGGFVIVAADRRVYPVLAFSPDGHFSFDNDAAMENFVDRIGSYIAGADMTESYDVTEDYSSCYHIEPIVQTSIGQRSPWDKYVVVDHPECPAGCVAVAAALVISHSKYELFNYHDTRFYLKSIITAIHKEQNNSTSNAPKKIVGVYTPDPPTYTYDEAVDLMAKLLYWIGKDVNMRYKPDGSTAFDSNAYDLCKSLGLNLATERILFDIDEVSWFLKDNHIIYVNGGETSGLTGHAWVIDGCDFCVDIQNREQIIKTFVHCDWGWGGSSNGYYTGEIFQAGEFAYRPYKYFAVKREWK